MRKIFAIYLFTFICVSCFYSNEFYFDIDNQLVKSCNSKGLQRLYLNSNTPYEKFLIVWEDSTRASPPELNFKNINSGYKIYKGWEEYKISNDSFRLIPMTSYTLKRIQGDASGYSLNFWIDSVGKVSKTTRGSCD